MSNNLSADNTRAEAIASPTTLSSLNPYLIGNGNFADNNIKEKLYSSLSDNVM
jgi:hypothetical protein